MTTDYEKLKKTFGEINCPYEENSDEGLIAIDTNMNPTTGAYGYAFCYFEFDSSGKLTNVALGE